MEVSLKYHYFIIKITFDTTEAIGKRCLDKRTRAPEQVRPGSQLHKIPACHTVLYIPHLFLCIVLYAQVIFLRTVCTSMIVEMIVKGRNTYQINSIIPAISQGYKLVPNRLFGVSNKHWLVQNRSFENVGKFEPQYTKIYIKVLKGSRLNILYLIRILDLNWISISAAIENGLVNIEYEWYT